MLKKFQLNCIIFYLKEDYRYYSVTCEIILIFFSKQIFSQTSNDDHTHIADVSKVA